MPSPTEETLERVYRRGHSLRARRRTLRGLAVVAAILALGVPAVVVSNGNHGGDSLRVAAGPDSSTTTATPETTFVPSTTGAPSSVAEATPTTTATTEAVRTTTPSRPPPAPAGASCRNSADPRCGPFRWDPAPRPNQPATLRVSYEPAEPVAGQEVVFTLVHTDPDSDARPHVASWQFGDGMGGASAVSCVADERYGPWSPPDPRPGTHTELLRHAYAESGTFTASFHTGAGRCGQDPYASPGDAVVTVAVRDRS